MPVVNSAEGFVQKKDKERDNIPLPHNAAWGNTQILTGEDETLSELRYEWSGISMVLCVDIQHMLPCSKNPLGWYWYELEDKSLYATCLLEPEGLGVEMLSWVSSLMALRMVSELHVRRVGWYERWRIRCDVTSSTHEPPQKYTLIRERTISLNW